MTQHKLIVLSPSVPPKESPLDYGSEPSFEEVKAACDMDPQTTLELVRCAYKGKPAWLLVDEDGLSKQLPFNRDATELTHGAHVIVGVCALWTGDFE